MRARAFLRGLLLAASLAGCAGRHKNDLATPALATSVANLDEFAVGLDAYAFLGPDDPRRERARRILIGFLVDYTRDNLRSEQDDEALEALQFALALWTPTELRSRKPDGELAGAAADLYAVSARRGAEEPSLLALAVMHQFGDPAQTRRALDQWTQLESWIVRNAMFADEPLLRHEELERTLEEVAAVFPSPLVVQRLADLYVARYQAAVVGSRQGRASGHEARQRAEVTGYLLIRLFLRADDFAGLESALSRVELDSATRKLVELVGRARQPARTAGPLLTLAAQFVPSGEADDPIPPVFATQGWGIAHNLARRAVAAHPGDPYAHYLMARVLAQQGLLDAPIHHLRAMLARQEQVFQAWERLADLEQRSLSRLARADPDQARERLRRIEALHARAVELWRDRPIHPGMPEAYFAVAEGLYEVGRVAEATVLLERSAALEAAPDTLDLLGTVALKQHRWDEARRSFSTLLKLPQEGDHERLHWEMRAHAQLAEIARRQGKDRERRDEARAAIQRANQLLTLTELDAGERAVRHLERGRLLYDLGEVDLGIADFRSAIAADPTAVQVYADTLLFLVARGRLDQARETYLRALARPEVESELKLYFTLWITELARRRGEPPQPEAVAFLRGYVGRGWEKMLARHARGELAFDKLLAGARDPGEKAEAYFYEALRRWSAGDRRGAQTLLREVVRTQMMGFAEYDMAQAHLESQELEARPR